MVEIRQVKTKKEQREFLNFPLKLYKGCPYYSPNLYMSEKAIFKKDYFYYKTCDAIYFNAYRDGKIVGRIGGILQKAANEKWKQKRVRFTRFDLIDDLEVAKALLEAVENWAKDLGMEEVFGPMGFSDMEKEGLLIEGFEEPTTLNENYNYEYYKTHLEALGYVKDVDWIAHQARCPKDFDIEKTEQVVNRIMEKYELHYCTEKNTNRLLKNYGHQFFDIVEESYKNLYQTVPFTEEQIKDMISSFRLVLNRDFVEFILDKNERVVAFALSFPMISPILNKTGGKLYPWILPQLLWNLKHSKVHEFGLIGVRDEYRLTGIAWGPLLITVKKMREGKIDYCETNLTLEDNHNILNMLHKLDLRDHRRVRAYIKKVN